MPPWWQHAKTRCAFEIYAILCISGNTKILKIKIFNHQNIVLFYIPVPGGVLPIVPLTPLFQGDHQTTLYTTGKGAPNIRFIEAHKKISPKHVPVFPVITNLGEIWASSSKNVKTHGRIQQTSLSSPKFWPGPSQLKIRSLKWVPMTVDRSKKHRSSDISAWCAMYHTQLQANTCHLTNRYRLLQCMWRNTIIRDEKH